MKLMPAATSQPKVYGPDDCELGSHPFPGNPNTKYSKIRLPTIGGKPLHQTPLVGCILRVEYTVCGANQRRDVAIELFGDYLLS